MKKIAIILIFILATTSRGMLGSSTAGDLLHSTTGQTLYHKE